ncbi:MAG: tetratricopeptide repeat protein, partial [Myxococcaceae bacterium]
MNPLRNAAGVRMTSSSLKRSLAVAVALALASGGSALAQAKKTTSKKTTATTTTKDGKAGASADKSTGPAQAEAKKERKGPAKFNVKDQYKLGDAQKEALADKKRDESIEQLKKIIPKFEDGAEQKAELLFQLSELYWEKSQYLYRVEMKKLEDDQATYDVAMNKGDKSVKEPKEDHRQSELFRSETMRLYETILRDYPSYNRKDEVLFSLAYNQYEIGKKDAAVKRYEELIKNYPTSKFVPDAYVQLGNHYFDNNNLAKAEENYKRAYATKIPKIASYALYKLGWCDYNAGRLEDGLKKMQDVVSFSEDKKEFTDLKNEALNDMVSFYVQLDRVDDAISYYKAKAGKKKQPKLIGKLSYGLADAGHHDSAIKGFRYLINDAPMGAAAPEYQQAIVKSYEGLRQRENVKAEIKKLVDLYAPGSQWWKANEADKSIIRNAFSLTEEAMRTMVTDYHAEAQKTKSVATYKLARDIYKQYVDAFASSSDENFVSDQAFNLRFFYAEILWSLEDWEEAAKQYDAVVDFKIPNRDTAKEASNENYRKLAAYNSVLAYTNLLNIERGIAVKTQLDDNKTIDEKKKKDNVKKQAAVKRQKLTEEQMKEKPLTTIEGKLVAACDRYNSMFPNNPDEIELRYQAAVILFDKSHFVDAARRFSEVILKWPEEKRSQDAADITMSVLEDKEEWLELNKLARAFLGNKKLSKPNTDFTKRVAGVVEGSQYKWVDEVVYKKEKNPSKAAEEFLKFVEEFPRSDNADRALTYAMIIFQEANQIDRGVEAGERVLKEYPGSVFELKTRYTLAVFY